MSEWSAETEEGAIALVKQQHPTAWCVEAYDALVGWDVYVYATRRAWETAPADDPGATAAARYRVLAE